jgi:UPF0716 protein FxsA
VIFPMVGLFILLPLAEIWVLLQVGRSIGPLNTIAALLLMGFLGAWIVKREGRRTFLDLQTTLQQGRVPTNELLQGFLILLGGLLMVTPGFVTDFLGLLLVLPPTRAIALRVTKQILIKRIAFKTVMFTNQNHSFDSQEKIRDVGPRPQNTRPPGNSSSGNLL